MPDLELLSHPQEMAVLVLAPAGRDAKMMASVLERDGITAEILPDIGKLSERLKSAAGAVIITEEALAYSNLAYFQKQLFEQPAWSDLPVVLLSEKYSVDGNNDNLVKLFSGSNISFLERPLHSITLLSTIRTSLKARKKQYQVRDLIAKQAEYVEELKKTNQELGIKNRELEQFAYVASHDLQEPLRTIVTFCEILQKRLKESLDVETSEFMRHLMEASLRAKQLVSDLLSYSRIDKERKLDWVDFNKAVETAKQHLKALIEENQAIVTADTLPRIPADTTQIVQLFQNLIGNAIKFKREHPPQVHITAFSRQENGEEHWVISVQDNGIGIEPQYWERIFVIFQRLQTTKEGTGIGLAICKKIVERHKGSIWIDSEPGKGTSFFFSFPKELSA